MTDRELHWQQVTDPRQVEVLTGTSCLYFEAFLGRSRTVGEVAKDMQILPGKVLYHVKKALHAGLLRVVETRQRAGKPIQVYRSSAEMYFVPFEATSAETLEAWLLPVEQEWRARWREHAARAMGRSRLTFGLRLWRDPQHGVIIKPTPAPPRAVNEQLLEELPVLALWSELRLSPQDAQALRAELLALHHRYSLKAATSPPQSGGQLLHLAITPLMED